MVARRALHAAPGLAVRFIHFALFDSTFLSLHYYLVDYAVCLGFGCSASGCAGRQMVTRYGWINERAGLLRWRRRDGVRQPRAGKIRVTFPPFAH